MISISSSLAKFSDQLAGLLKLVKLSLETSRGNEYSELKLYATLSGGRYIPPLQFYPSRKIPKEGIVRSVSDRKISERERHRKESLDFIRDYYSGAIGAVPNVPVGGFKGFAGDMPLFKLKWRMQSMMTSAARATADAAKAFAGMYMPSELPS